MNTSKAMVFDVFSAFLREENNEITKGKRDKQGELLTRHSILSMMMRICC